MIYNKSKEKETVQKTIRIPIELLEKVEDLGAKNERDFSKQVNFMLKKYIELVDEK